MFLDLAGKPTLVIGGGNVAEGKVRGLLAAEASLTVIAPELTPELRTLADAGRLQHIAREYRDGDVAGYTSASSLPTTAPSTPPSPPTAGGAASWSTRPTTQ